MAQSRPRRRHHRRPVVPARRGTQARRGTAVVGALALALSAGAVALARPWESAAGPTDALALTASRQPGMVRGGASPSWTRRAPRTRTHRATGTTRTLTTSTRTTLTPATLTPATLTPATRPTTTAPTGTTVTPTTGATATTRPVSSTVPPLGSIRPQPGLVVYGASSGIGAYARRGALVVAGRDNYADQAFKDVAASGGTVLVYLDAVIDNPYGRYHQLLNQNSACGPATSRWPGNPNANQWGHLNDFRPGSVLQAKLECVLETMVTENPHLGGFFADDLGSRSWFPDITWSGWSATDKASYRQGAVDLTKTFRKVADRHHLVVVVNGSWSAGDGGGYPDAARSGTALADGGFIEHHDTVDQFFRNYACSSQWAASSPITAGRPINFAVSTTTAGTQAWADSGCVGYAATQSDYGTTPTPWGQFYDRGLPSGVPAP